LAVTILCLYLALQMAAGAMFLGMGFVKHFFWITIAYGIFLCPWNMVLAKKTQKYIYRRIHRLVYADEELTLEPGELPAARRAVLTIPWVAAGRDVLAWTLSIIFYCFCVLRPYVIYMQNAGHPTNFPSDVQFWTGAFFLLAFPFAPLVLMAALLAYSAATTSYTQFFFREGEYEHYLLALSPVRRRYTYIGLVGYTLLIVIAALDYRFMTQNFPTASAAFSSVQEIEAIGAYLLVVVCSLLFLLSRQEIRQQRRLPLMLQERAPQKLPDKRCPKCDLVVGGGMDVCPQDGTVLAFPDKEAAAFGTSYEFLEEIGHGGMSVIYKARHRLLRKVVAIKMLDTRYVSDFQAAGRFLHEARTVFGLQHPNIVSVLDFGLFESSKLFLVMEYLPGVSLATLISDNRAKLPLRDCLQIFMQICDAMAYAHDKRILHRDLKPSNVMVACEEASYSKYSIKIVDFGLAKVLEGTAGNLTKTGDVFGTPNYMSPEQCLGQQLDVRSDIYSMGCLMYETLTGVQPAASDSPLATMYKQINEQPQAMAELRQELSAVPQLSEVVSTAMAKRPEQRYGTFAQLRAALQSVASTAAATQRAS